MMKPEDIDKLFKDRLGKAAPTPPADLWSRLQERMEKEIPQSDKHQLQHKTENRRFLWLYTAIAAAISLVLTVGVVFYSSKTTSEVSKTIAKKEPAPKLQELPAFTAPASVAIAQADKESDKISDMQATETTSAASDQTDTIEKQNLVAKVKPIKPALVAASEKLPIADKSMIAEKTKLSNKLIEAPAVVAPEVNPAPVMLASANENLNAEPVEIIIKRAVASQMNTAETEHTNGNDNKASLAKSIFKQVKNLAQGEPVELSEIVRADKISLETQIGKQKISKVINL